MQALLECHFGQEDFDNDIRCPVGCTTSPPQVEKVTTLKRWAPVLFLTLKRFKRVEGGTFKIRTLVQHSDRGSLMLGGKHTYHLHAIVEHKGSDFDTGHYITFERRTDTLWLECDDEHAPRVVTLEEVLQKEAYLLFYQRDTLEETPATIDGVHPID